MILRSKWLPNQESGIFPYSIVSVYKLLGVFEGMYFFSEEMKFSGVVEYFRKIID